MEGDEANENDSFMNVNEGLNGMIEEVVNSADPSLIIDVDEPEEIIDLEKETNMTFNNPSQADNIEILYAVSIWLAQ